MVVGASCVWPARASGPGRTVGCMGDVEVRGFRLFAGCLASKHGFGDGNVPDEVAERFQPSMWDDAWYVRALAVWQHVLAGLVRDRLIPALGVEVVLPPWSDHSMHNPCEATSIGGVPLYDEDGRRINQDRDWYALLQPAYVDVPWAEVGERLAAAMADPAVGRDGAHRGDRPAVEG